MEEDADQYGDRPVERVALGFGCHLQLDPMHCAGADTNYCGRFCGCLYRLAASSNLANLPLYSNAALTSSTDQHILFSGVSL